jgi:hypothetical protein
MKFTIDRSKWRCGGRGPNQRGKYKTQLLNKLGYMCCLGQILEQLGFERTKFLGVCQPSTINFEYENILIKGNGYSCQNSYLAEAAMAINDNDSITDSEREEKLTELFLW